MQMSGFGDAGTILRVYASIQKIATRFTSPTIDLSLDRWRQNFTAIKGAPGGDDYHTVWINPENPQIIAARGRSGSDHQRQRRPDVEFVVQPADRAVLSRHHRQPVSLLGLWRPAGERLGVAPPAAATTARSRFATGIRWESRNTATSRPIRSIPTSIYGGKVTRFNRTTGQMQDISPVVLRTGKYRFYRTAPVIFSPVDPHILYFGSNVLFKTTDGGDRVGTSSVPI